MISGEQKIEKLKNASRKEKKVVRKSLETLHIFTVSPNTASSNFMLPQAHHSKRGSAASRRFFGGRLCLFTPSCFPTAIYSNNLDYFKLIISKIDL